MLERARVYRGAKESASLGQPMTEQEIYDGVIVNGTSDFRFVVETLRRHGAGWCVIGGLAVNSYVTPVYTADLDLVVIATDLEPILADLRAADFRVKEFPFSTNAQRRAGRTETAVSKLMVQFTKPDRYQPFVERAVLRSIFGIDVPVAALADLVQGKLWAWSDSTRRASKHAKDQGDLLRLGEAYPEVLTMLPSELRAEIEQRQGGDNSWGDDEMDAS